MAKKSWYEINMTSNTTPSPFVVSTSGGGFGSGHLSQLYQAFDNDNTTHSFLAVGSDSSKEGVSRWIQLDFGKNTRVEYFKYIATGTTQEPHNFILQGSDNGITFTNIVSEDGLTWYVGQMREYSFPPVYFRYYRLFSTKNNGNTSSYASNIYFGYTEYDYKVLFFSNGEYKSYNGTNWLTVTTSKPTETDFLLQGMDKGIVHSVPEIAIAELGSTFEVLEYTDDPYQETMFFTIETEPFSVYDYILENPQVVIYTESTEDIIVSTVTEPYDLYDEFDDEVEVLLYTDNKTAKEADLIIDANWSPVDELIGDFEVVTWSDEPQATAQRVLELTAIPKPQFVKLANPKRLYGYLDDVLAIDDSKSYRDEVRYLFTDEKATKWYAWDFEAKNFVEVDASTHELILKNGMKHTDIVRLTKDDWRTWTKDYINIGVFLKDNVRDTITSVVETISYEDYLPRDTVELEKSNFYILNTTSKIDIELNGNVLKGFLSDDDLTRVQYRVLLNGGNYYPADGSFTRLGESPQNIELIIGSNDIKIDDWNTIKVEFQDFFGTTDYWSTNFMGTYSGLMFKDVYGQYYSSEIGEVLQYLDFGVIIAGQTTIEHEVILKNQYGYDVENVHIYANTSNFPTGLECEFSPTQTPFSSNPELRLSGVLKNNEEMSFFVRLKTVLGATPDANGSFDIIVKADRVY